MSFPNVRGKHLESPIISWKEYLEYSKEIGRKPKFMPPNIVLCFSRRLIDRIQNIHSISVVPGIFEQTTTKLYSVERTSRRLGILAEFGVGAPATVMHMEELASWGAKRFVILGTAGGIGEKLEPGDVVVCTKSIRDEGTSHHYLPSSKFASPTRSLTERLYSSLTRQLGNVVRGPSWTTDAPYRETVKELVRYRSDGILTVEMEASAVFAVGKVRQLETAAVFVVSDLLTEKAWKPHMQSPRVLQQLVNAFVPVKQVIAKL